MMIMDLLSTLLQELFGLIEFFSVQSLALKT